MTPNVLSKEIYLLLLFCQREPRRSHLFENTFKSEINLRAESKEGNDGRSRSIFLAPSLTVLASPTSKGLGLQLAYSFIPRTHL